MNDYVGHAYTVGTRGTHTEGVYFARCCNQEITAPRDKQGQDKVRAWLNEHFETTPTGTLAGLKEVGKE